jgi:hypothetical protein
MFPEFNITAKCFVISAFSMKKQPAERFHSRYFSACNEYYLLELD